MEWWQVVWRDQGNESVGCWGWIISGRREEYRCESATARTNRMTIWIMLYGSALGLNELIKGRSIELWFSIISLLVDWIDDTAVKQSPLKEILSCVSLGISTVHFPFKSYLEESLSGCGKNCRRLPLFQRERGELFVSPFHPYSLFSAPLPFLNCHRDADGTLSFHPERETRVESAPTWADLVLFHSSLLLSNEMWSHQRNALSLNLSDCSCGRSFVNSRKKANQWVRKQVSSRNRTHSSQWTREKATGLIQTNDSRWRRNRQSEWIGALDNWRCGRSHRLALLLGCCFDSWRRCRFWRLPQRFPD